MKISAYATRFAFAGIFSGVCTLACSAEDPPSEGVGGGAGTGSSTPVAGASAGNISMSGTPSTGGSISNSAGTASGGTTATAGSGSSVGGASAGTSGTTAGASTGGKASGGSGGGGSGGGSAGTTKSKGCGAASWPKSKNDITITVGGKARTYNLQVPENYDTNKPYRLIFAIHWLNGTAKNVTDGKYYGLLPLSENSTIFVAPQGINNGWSDTGRSKTKGGQDVDLMQALLTEMENTLCIDTTRVFSEGFSMGGSMSYALACAMGAKLRGVAVHSGGPMSGCVDHTTPVAYFMTHGTKDSVCTYPGYGVPQVEDFAKVNGCMTATLPTPTNDQGVCIDYPGCSAGHPTRGCIFVGDHVYNPGGSKQWVPAETWKFISQF
jgi:poly(3-hydroxybutyrate) depolymerase